MNLAPLAVAAATGLGLIYNEWQFSLPALVAYESLRQEDVSADIGIIVGRR